MTLPSSHYFVWRGELYQVNVALEVQGIRICISTVGEGKPVLSRIVSDDQVRLSGQKERDFETIIKFMLETEDEFMATGSKR